MGGGSHSHHDSSDEIVLNQEKVLPYGLMGLILALVTIFALAQAGRTTINFNSGENAYNMIQKEKEDLKNYSFKSTQKTNVGQVNTQPNVDMNQEEHNSHDGHNH